VLDDAPAAICVTTLFAWAKAVKYVGAGRWNISTTAPRKSSTFIEMNTAFRLKQSRKPKC